MAAMQNLTGVPSMAVGDLGMGTMLNQQQVDETDEEKKRKRLGMSPLQSPAVMQLFGPGAGIGGGGGRGY